MVMLFLEIHESNILWFINVIFFMFLFISSLSWLSFSISCPKCKNSIGIYALKNNRLMHWIDDFKNLRECPICRENFNILKNDSTD